ncbi:MAG: Gfo/Idh/MocA family oxidoreductase [Rhizobiaceae bacterium]|nr:Gfo/Idh/MocA family oxidoreductase [Rhizobiaceae bacterium]
MARIAHVGHGYWGKNLARNFAELGALEAVVDENRAVADEAAKLLGARSATFDEVLADAAIDGVSLASPASLHAKQAIMALKAGKHVFVEKPLALTIDDAQQVCNLASAKSLKLMVGHLLQYHPVFAALRTMVQDGELGAIRYAYSNRLSLGKFRAEENVLWSFAPHDLSMLLSVFGEEPSSVTAQGNVWFQPGIADLACVQMHFPSGGSGHLLASWMHPFKEQRFVVVGDKASAVFEDTAANWDRKLAIYRHEFDMSGSAPVARKAEAAYIAVPRSEPLKTECSHFVECIDEGRQPLTDGEEGLRVLKVLQAAEDALAQNLALQNTTGGRP